MTKMAAMPIYGKNLSGTKKPLTLKLNWYAASGAQVLPSLLKWDPELTLTYFVARSNLVLYMPLYGKKVKQWIFLKLL